jgi:hypothetical protein
MLYDNKQEMETVMGQLDKIPFMKIQQEKLKNDMTLILEIIK